MIECFYLIHGWVRVDLEVMAIKGYYTFPRSLGLALYHQTQFSDIQSILVEAAKGGMK